MQPWILRCINEMCMFRTQFCIAGLMQFRPNTDCQRAGKENVKCNVIRIRRDIRMNFGVHIQNAIPPLKASTPLFQRPQERCKIHCNVSPMNMDLPQSSYIHNITLPLQSTLTLAYIFRDNGRKMHTLSCTIWSSLLNFIIYIRIKKCLLYLKRGRTSFQEPSRIRARKTSS